MAIPEAASRLRAFIAAGHHATMAWMEETEERRSDPRRLWPDVRSVIMLAMDYGPRAIRSPISPVPRSATFRSMRATAITTTSSRASSRDGRAPCRAGGADVKVFVDTAPLMEKAAGGRSRHRLAGKHTNLVSREHGSWLFLGAILTDAFLPPDQAEADHCGSCRACLDICPTAAFPAPYRIVAGRCISYLTTSITA